MTTTTHRRLVTRPLRKRLHLDSANGRKEALEWFGTALVAAALVLAVKMTALSLTVVTTDSMEPTLMPRDYVVTLSPAVIRPEIGSVIVFRPTMNGTALPAHIHRIVAQNPDGTWQTRGDNATGNDPWRVEATQVVGVATGLTLPVSVTRNPLIFGFGAFLASLLALWPSRGNRPTTGGGTTGRVSRTVD